MHTVHCTIIFSVHCTVCIMCKLQYIIILQVDIIDIIYVIIDIPIYNQFVSMEVTKQIYIIMHLN